VGAAFIFPRAFPPPMPPVAVVESRLPPQTVWTWWTDHGPVGSETLVEHGMGKSWRVVREREGNRVVLEERLRLPGKPKVVRIEVEMDPARRAMSERAPTYEAEWTFEATATGDGTRITRRMALKGLGRLTPDPLSRRLMERDLRHHVRQMEAEIAGGR
jgi:hypothetical protein